MEEDSFLKDFERLEKLDDSHIELGWFSEQGKHPTANMTYPELGFYHAVGMNGVIPRDILGVFSFEEFDTGGGLDRLLPLILNNPNDNVQDTLDRIGKRFTRKIKKVFGSSSLHPTPHNPNPMIETGALRRAVRYKTSANNILKKG